MKTITPCRDAWKGTMTDRERFNNQMHYKSIDRCFNMEFGWWSENFELWDIFKDNNIKSNEDGDIFFNFDKIHQVGLNNFMLPGFEHKVVEETETSKIVMNGDGLLAEVPKDGHDTIPHYIKATICTPDDWKKVKEERFIVGDPRRIPNNLEELKKIHSDDRDYPLGVSCGSLMGRIRDMLTFEGIAFAIYDEANLDAVLPHFNFDFASGWEDICYKSGPIVTLDFFTNVVVPRYKRIGKKLKEHNIDFWYTDCDGDVRPLIPGFLEAGINCLFPYEVNSCIFAGDLLDEYGKDLRIMGGVDKLEMIKGKDAIKAYLERLAPYVERGGYIPFCDHRCPPDVKEEDYIYYLDLKEEMFGM
jgi:hypothetical protein